MILITGGVASGKRTYARRTLGYTDEQMADAVLDARPVLYNLQNLVARAPENALDRNERETREQTGRLVNRLAAEAERVVRMVCGLPQVLK